MTGAAIYTDAARHRGCRGRDPHRPNVLKLFRDALTHAVPRGNTGLIGVHLWPASTLLDVRAFLSIATDGRDFSDEPSAASDSGIARAVPRRALRRHARTRARLRHGLARHAAVSG